MSAINDKFAIVPIEAFYDESLTPAEFRMLSVLYSFRDKNANTVWPKLETLADRAGYSDTTQVSRMTTKLEKKGWLTKGKKRGPRGPKIYELTVPDRIQVVRGGQVDYLGQVDNSEQEKRAPERQVDSGSQVDNPEPNRGANLTVSVNSQLDRDGQLSYEQTSINKPITQQSSDPYGSGGNPPELVDNSLGALGELYSSENPTRDIFRVGTQFLMQYGHAERSARSFIGQQIQTFGESKTLDAMIKTMIYEPVDPTAWLLEVLQRAERSAPISMDWTPPDGWAQGAAMPTDQGGLGFPLDLVRKARDTFVLWFNSTGVPHHDWLDMFRRWCAGDWARAQHNRSVYLKRLATAGGLGEFVHFQS